jgi:Zn-dependent M28 family amino/carboxypeptidase
LGTCAAALVAAALLVGPVQGQTLGEYAKLFDANKLRSMIRFLSDDGFEGRGPGTRGGELSAKYIAHQLESYGVKPGNKGSFFQPVSLVGVKTDPKTKLTVTNSGGTSVYNFGDEYVGNTEAQVPDVTVDADLVFVGYGIDAPEQNWNDYKGAKADYRGKMLVMMVNDPPATDAEPNLFGGKALTYYGRWTYKYEQAARMGAAGVILIHTTESAGYGWNVVRTSNGNIRYEIARTEGDKTPFLQVRSWVTDEAAKRMFKESGLDLDALRSAAKKRDFVPVKLGAKAKLEVRSDIKRVDSNNVVGLWEGSDAALKSEYVVYTAHWDHLGIGEPNAAGDNIYNGALDNASGVAQVLAIAESFTKLPAGRQPKRSQVFLFVTAEEQGLLGADWYTRFPSVPLGKTAANINIDGGNFFGLTRDFGALGAERSTLGAIVDEALKERGLSFSPDTRPEQGFFFRSDHFPFAKAGVPALSIRTGTDFVGKEKDWSEKFFAEYNAKNYHQPSDEFDENWVFDGMVQMLDVSFALGMKASNVGSLPKYNKGDEFAAAQPNR